jgi:hypothetical protein
MRNSMTVGLMVSSSFGEERFEETIVTWQDLVEAFTRGLEASVCILALDDGWRSSRIREAIKRRYVDIDAATGKHLVVFTVVPPPDDWFRLKADQLSQLPDWALRVARAQSIAIKRDEQSGKVNSARIFNHYFENAPRPPALYFFVPTALSSAEAELSALAFSFSGFVFEDRLVAAFAYLGRLAQEVHRTGGDAFDLARQGFRWGTVRSLAWQNAAFATVSALTVVQEWIEQAKRAVQGGG